MNPSSKHHLLEIYRAGLDAVNPRHCVSESLFVDASTLFVHEPDGGSSWHHSLDRINRIFLVGCGKASVAMGSAVADVLGDRLDSGFIVTKDGHAGDHPKGKISIREASHPVPDERGVLASRETMKILASAGRDDLVIACISGGGSALWPLPAEGLTLLEKQQVTDLLLRSGADIGEMNCVRKHLSAIKGGRAGAATNAAVLVLELSDVIGDRLEVIASGPFYPDPTTFGQAQAILDKYNLTGSLPPSVIHRIQGGIQGSIAETPKPGAACFSRIHHVLCGSNAIALAACADQARELGWDPIVISSTLSGDVQSAAEWFCDQVLDVAHAGRRPCCVLSGGETTVHLGSSTGKGGRNQEFALLCAQKIAGSDNLAVLSCGTDGTDGPTDAAGAYADGTTVDRAGKAGLDSGEMAAGHNSYILFEQLGDLVKTGPTGTNVMDLQIALINP
jgi:glycerate 2-kinase